MEWAILDGRKPTTRQVIKQKLKTANKKQRVKRQPVRAEPWPGASRGWGPITRKLDGEQDG
jgi:hypothetical protein